MTRLNYTGRRRIARQRIGLKLSSAGGGSPSLSLTGLNLDGLSLDDAACVLVEAYRQTTRRRIDCGTVGNPQFPSGVPLQEFNDAEGLLFRVKVVGVGDNDGKLLASADRVPADADEHGQVESLIPFQPSHDLGERLWKLDVDEDRPILLVNADVGDWHSLALDPHFQCLIFPEVVRRVARWLLDNIALVDDEPGGPTAKWARFFVGLGLDPTADTPEEEEAKDDWAEQAADRFARRHHFMTRLKQLVESGGTQ